MEFFRRVAIAHGQKNGCLKLAGRSRWFHFGRGKTESKEIFLAFCFFSHYDTDMKKYLTTTEAAARLGVSTARVRELALAGRLEKWKPSPRVLLIEERSVAGFRRRSPGRKKLKKNSGRT
jgi:excisionase family DNA binding protein